jgi:hypothetical protein
MMWLATGLAAGLAVAYFWPPERAYATNADRDANFAMVTIPVGTNVAGIQDALDGVFILDFPTGQLKGAVINRQTGKFTALYFRDLAKDFKVDPDAQPHYAMVTGYGQVAGQAGLSFSAGILYVAELSSGKLAAYTFPWKEVLRPAGQNVQLYPLDVIQWRQPVKKDS